MTGPTPEPEGTPLAAAELLARAVLTKRWFNQQTRALRPDAFEPPRDGNLSVTRHLMADEPMLWARCRRVAEVQGKNFHGRADVSAAAVIASRAGMSAVAAAREHDPGHAHVIGWPEDDSARLSVQVALAAAATFVAAPAAAP